jgi:hypothetical protein
MAGEFYRQRVGQHLEIGLKALEKLKSQEWERLHSRKLRSFAEVAFHSCRVPRFRRLAGSCAERAATSMRARRSMRLSDAGKWGRSQWSSGGFLTFGRLPCLAGKSFSALTASACNTPTA